MIESDESLILKGSSKYEIIISHLLSMLHEITCTTNVSSFNSFVTGDGSQFVDENGKKLSLDFFCQVCHIGIAIEGTYKLIFCRYHKLPTNGFFFGKTKKELYITSQNNRKTI